MKQELQLSELADRIKLGLKQTLQPVYWVVGEISEVYVHGSGHCYLTLIEKDESKTRLLAKMNAVIWANTFRMLQPYFRSETGCELTVGMKILVQVSVDFSGAYGLNLQITDINPTFTIGEDERNRQRIIRQLETDGVFDLQKTIELPTVIQRVAVISSETAAGYQDFCQQLAHNQYGFAVQITLFSAAMQGKHVEQSVCEQLNQIFERENEFDVVVIIRGGGSRADLRWFDNYEIAQSVANFPLPILTGIGHDKDKSITDLVAHLSLKTPTAVAAFVIEHNADFLVRLQDLQDLLSKQIKNRISEQNMRLITISTAIKHGLNATLNNQQNELKNRMQLLRMTVKNCITNFGNSLKLLEVRVAAKNPDEILKQGYTFTTDESGKMVNSVKKLTKNQTIITQFKDGKVTSIVQ